MSVKTKLGVIVLIVCVAFTAGTQNFWVQEAKAQEYTGYGTVGLALRPVDHANPGNLLPTIWWFACGAWRFENETEGGINSEFDIPFPVIVDKEAGTILFEGDVDCQLRRSDNFEVEGNLSGHFRFLVSGVDFGVDPITSESIFAIGRTAAGEGSITLRSDDSSVSLGATGQDDSITVAFVDKYKNGANANPIFGPFDTDPFNLYVGPRYGPPGNLFFSGTTERGFNAWLMAAPNQGNIFINGIEMLPPPGDIHGDLVGPCEDEGFGPDEQPDQCGVCGGDGTSCLDCAGVVNGTAMIDRCGVCGGDGTSCIPACADVDILGEQFIVDSSALELRNLVRRAARLLRKRVGTRKAKRQARTALQTAKTLYQRVWSLVWSFDSMILTCEESAFCVQSSNVSELTSLSTGSDDLQALVKSTVRQVRAGTGHRKIGRKLIKRANKVRGIIDTEVANIPTASAACTF